MNSNPVQNPYFFQRKKHTHSSKMYAAHSHPTEHELYFLLGGNTTYFVGDRVYFLNVGEMIFIPKNTFHKTNYPVGGERVLFSFDDAFLGEDYAPYIQEMCEQRHILFAKEDLPTIKKLVDAIEKENRTQKADFEEMQRLYFKQLLIIISRLRKTQIVDNTTPTVTFVQSIAKHISTHFSEDLSLVTLAKTFSVSPSYLSKLFKQTTGVGVKKYVTQVRIAAAKNMLITTSLSIMQVSSACGFNDSNHFATVFKALEGITPKKYALEYKER